MRWIVGRSLRYRWLAVFGAAVLLVFGFLQTRDADTDVFPEFAPPQVGKRLRRVQIFEKRFANGFQIGNVFRHDAGPMRRDR